MNSKQKGAEFERSCCKKLSLWLSSGTRDDLLWRSAMSGGRATLSIPKGKEASHQMGDISTVSAAGAALIDRFVIECKFYRDLNFFGILTGTGKLCDFWELVCTQAAEVKKNPMLLAKQNNRPTIMVIDNRGVTLLRVKGYVLASMPRRHMNLVLFDDFLKHAQASFE